MTEKELKEKVEMVNEMFKNRNSRKRIEQGHHSGSYHLYEVTADDTRGRLTDLTSGTKNELSLYLSGMRMALILADEKTKTSECEILCANCVYTSSPLNIEPCKSCYGMSNFVPRK